MKLEKFLGSKAKTDILKYLIFKRQGISIRALESELNRSFPAIKKQVDVLEEADVINIDKDNLKRSISLKPEVYNHIKILFVHSLKNNINAIIKQNEGRIDKIFFGKIFGKNIDIDLVVIHKLNEKEFIDQIKENITGIFGQYFINNISVVFMLSDEFEKRYRLADKFVLQIMRAIQNND